MKLSVIIPTYNRNDLLKKCLDALHPEKQGLSVENYETIVTDDSEHNLAKQLIDESYPWVKWVAGPKRGPAANRNSGAQHSTTEWLVFIDDDVVADHQLVWTYVSAIQNNINIAVFEGFVNADRPKERLDEESPINLQGGNLWSCNFAIKKSLFSNLSGFDETFPFAAMEDIDFKTKIIAKQESIMFLKGAIVIHPWRRVIPFTTIKKHFQSHRFFKNKNLQYNSNYTWSRFKVFIGSTISMSKELIKFRFKGVLFFFDRMILNFLLIFA